MAGDSGHFVQEFVAGWFGGVAGLLAGHPFDTIKARLQTDGIVGKGNSYRGTVHCFTDMVKTEGVRSLYKGMSAPLVGMAFVNAIVFGVQGNLMKIMEPNLMNSFLAGMVSGAAQSVICGPAELIKLRMQMQRNPTKLFSWHATTTTQVYKDPWDAVRKIYRKDGPFRGIYKGFHITLWREVPGFGVYFASYDFMCQYLSKTPEAVLTYDDLSPLTLCATGGLSGIVAWMVSYPFDVLKSRIQVDGMYGEVKYRGIVDCCRQSYRDSGVKVFFRGLNSTLIRAFAVNAATFPTVALVLRYYKSNSSNNQDS